MGGAEVLILFFLCLPTRKAAVSFVSRMFAFGGLLSCFFVLFTLFASFLRGKERGIDVFVGVSTFTTFWTAFCCATLSTRKSHPYTCSCTPYDCRRRKEQWAKSLRCETQNVEYRERQERSHELSFLPQKKCRHPDSSRNGNHELTATTEGAASLH